MVADPGYQQYMPGEEREFTLGPTAHNIPILNGKAQEFKSGKTLSQGKDGEEIFRVKVDITACYPRELNAGKILRTIWLLKGRLVVVADQIDGPKVETVSYHWHGCPDAAWRIDDNWALLYAEPASVLWLSSPSFAISDANLHRLPGSRGQLTLSVQRKAIPVIWWLFSLSNERPAFEYDSGGRWVRLLGQRFSVE